MKALLGIFIDQIQKGEIWKRFWTFNRLKPFNGWSEYRDRTSRRITIEDAPALMLSGVCGFALIGLLYFCSHFVNIGHYFAIAVILAFAVISALSSRKD